MNKEDRIDALHTEIYDKQIEIDDLKATYEESSNIAHDCLIKIEAAKNAIDDLEEKLSNLEAT